MPFIFFRNGSEQMCNANTDQNISNKMKNCQKDTKATTYIGKIFPIQCGNGPAYDLAFPVK
jgi:hypothetical protein